MKATEIIGGGGGGGVTDPKVCYTSQARFHVEVRTRISIRNTQIYIAPYDKINHRLVNLSCNCDVKSDLNQTSFSNTFGPV